MSGCGPGKARCQVVRESTSWAPSTVFFMSCPNHTDRHTAVDTLVKTLKVFLDGSVCGDRECDDCAAQYMMRDALRAAGEVVDE